jgi:microcystin-dependent protein
MSDAFIGEVRLFPYTYTPMYFAACNGALVSVGQYTPLFAVIQSRFGGDGQTTFGLPNLQGRAVMSAGQGGGLSKRTFATSEGELTVKLNPNNLPAHAHDLMTMLPADLNFITDQANNSFLSRAKVVGGASGQQAYFAPQAVPDVLMAAAIQNTGPNTAHPNAQPYAVIGFCIALEGVFPSRN